ncbi:LPS export ABC transporter periplasmic protein LptC [bacterium]|nr:LPS export ABC transporter periplasmic protein LptC [bacterium]
MKWKNLSKKRKAYFIAGAVVVGIMLWAFVAAGIITRNFNRSQVEGQQDKQEALIHGIILTETKDEHKYWEIYGETGTYTSDNSIAMLDNCIGNFYDKDNEVSMSFESTKGSYNSDKKQIILYQNTHIIIKDGTSLEADRVVWSGNDKPITAKGNIRITRKDEFFATADLVEISPNYDNFKIIGKAVSKVYKSKEK